jgi:hypothetical protein
MALEQLLQRCALSLRLRSIHQSLYRNPWLLRNIIFPTLSWGKKGKRIDFGNLVGGIFVSFAPRSQKKEKEHTLAIQLGSTSKNRCCKLCQQYFPISSGPTWALESRIHHVQLVDGRRSNSRHSFTPTRDVITHTPGQPGKPGRRISRHGERTTRQRRQHETDARKIYSTM